MLLTCILFFSCEKEEVIDEVIISETSVTNLAKISESNPDVTFLQSQENFNSTALNAIEEINSFLQDAQGTINFSDITAEEGVLVFPDSESFVGFYENIKNTDEDFQVFLEEKYDALLAVALENPEIINFYENDEEEIVFGIEDFMWHHDIYDHNFQKIISDNLPINSLWSKVKSLTDAWLEDSGEDLDMDQDPSDLYVDNEHIQLLLNERSNIKISNQLETLEEITENSRGENQAEFASCVTKTTKRVVQSRRRKLTVKVFVRDWGKIQEAGASIIGYQKRRRRWKRRRFGKNLSASGHIIYNNVFTCEMEIYRSRSRSSNRRRFRTIALGYYNAPGNFSLRVKPNMNKFSGNGSASGVATGNIFL